MAAPTPKPQRAPSEEQKADNGEAAALVRSLPDDGVVCDHDAGALQLSQATSKSLS